MSWQIRPSEGAVRRSAAMNTLTPSGVGGTSPVTWARKLPSSPTWSASRVSSVASWLRLPSGSGSSCSTIEPSTCSQNAFVNRSPTRKK